MPTIPAAARRAGATSFRRCTGSTFALGVELEGEDLDAPGKVPAVLDALRPWAERLGATLEWRGSQAYGVIVHLP